MGDNMEDKLDEDFLFYLTFTKTFFQNLIDKYDVELCQAWLRKLCSEEATGVAGKRCRNIYLSQLVLSMQEGKLRGPFQEHPPDGSLKPPQTVFGPETPPLIKVPAWLDKVVEGSCGDVSRTSRDGRTYLAMRNLGQRGAFGCVAVNTEQPEPQWRGAAAGAAAPAAAGCSAECEGPSVRLAGGGSAHDVTVRLAGGSDALPADDLRFCAPPPPPARPRSPARARSPEGAASAARRGIPGRRQPSAEARWRSPDAQRGAFGEGAARGRAASRRRGDSGGATAPGSQLGVENMPPLQVLDNIRHMLSTRPAPDDRNKVLEFYRMLIENVDDVWNGKAEPIPEVMSLLKKIHQGLKGVLPPLNAEQHSQTVLTILREKLVRRVSEVDERERKLLNAEKLLTKPPEEVTQEKIDIPSPLSDVLWNEAINQTPKRQNLIKLQGMYDEALIDKFVSLLTIEKGKIIGKFKKQYEKSVQSMKQSLQDKISDAVNAYILAREDWAEVSCLLENVQNAQIKAALRTTGEDNSTKEHWQVINQLLGQIKESQIHYEGEIQRGEDLRMLLVAEHQSSHLLKLIASNNMQQLQNDHNELCDAINQLLLEIKNQHKRIDELNGLLL